MLDVKCGDGTLVCAYYANERRTTVAPTLTLKVPPTKAGIAEARLELERLEETLALEWATPIVRAGEERSTSPVVNPKEPATVVYERSTPGGRSRELLELIPAGKAAALTPTEIGRALQLGPGGKPLSKASARAITRNIQKLEGHLLTEGAISRRLLMVDFDDYDNIGSGKYYISDEDRQVLDKHVGP
jgi:hypothetical protein